MHTEKDIGAFPVRGEEARARKELLHLTRENMLHVVRGDHDPILLSFFVSNDFCHMGLFTVPTGAGARHSDLMKHKGDLVAYVENGPVTFYLTASGETFVVDSGSSMFIPEGFEYQIVNYSPHVVSGVFMVAPGL